MRLIMFMLACLLAGCGDGGRFPTVPVEGKITFSDGTPLPSGTRVVFNPSEGKVNVASGIMSQDGSFSLNAEATKYIVLLQPPEGGDSKNFYSIIPSEYCEGALVADVKAGMAPLDFKVKKAKNK